VKKWDKTEKFIDMENASPKEQESPLFYGRPVSGFRAGLSFSSCFSGCTALVMMPYLIYKNGAGVFWIALGLFMGMIVVWKYLPFRMLRFSRTSPGIHSFSDYLECRFGRGARILSVVSAGAFAIFTLFFSVQLLRLGREIFLAFLPGYDTWWVRALSVLLILPVLFLGLNLITWTGRPVSGIVLAALILVVLSIYFRLGGSGIVRYTMMSGVPNTVSEYMNLLYFDGEALSVSRTISLFMTGFLFAGLPISFPFFVTLKDTRQVKRARRSVFAWNLPVLVLSCFMGGISRAMLYVEGEAVSPADFTMKLYRSLWRTDVNGKIAAVLYVTALIAAFLLLLYFTFQRFITEVTAITTWLMEKKSGELQLGIPAACILLILASLRMPDMSWASVFFVLRFWACSAGPVMFSSLVIRRLSTVAVYAGVLLGSLGMVIPELLPDRMFAGHIPFFFGPEGAGSELFSIILSVLGIILFTRLFPERDRNVLKRFDDVKNRIG